VEASVGSRRSESRAMTAAAPILDVTDATFDTAVIAASSVRPVVVDFWAGWCAPCRTLGPILEQAVALHGGVTLAKLDVDANPEVTARFGIQGIPAVKGFRDGQLVAEFVGLQPRGQVERFLAQLAPAAPPPPPPSDEASLRAAVLDRPDDVTLRRALGALLLEDRSDRRGRRRCSPLPATTRCATAFEPGSRSAGTVIPRWQPWSVTLTTPRPCAA
jgi:thioredoxin